MALPMDIKARLDRIIDLVTDMAWSVSEHPTSSTCEASFGNSGRMAEPDGPEAFTQQ